MKTFKKIIWGTLLILVGVLLILRAFDVIHIELFFDGWWTLFIIVPCLNGLIFEKDKVGNLVGLAIGAILLLWRQDILSFDMLWKLILPVAIIGTGLSLILGGLRKKNANAKVKIKQNRSHSKNGCAVFSGCDMRVDGEVFEGGELVAVFGGVECDLRNAIIEKDCVIDAVAVFGGIDIIVPAHVNVKTDAFSLFGGLDNLTRSNPDGVTIYINGVSVFGGIEVK